MVNLCRTTTHERLADSPRAELRREAQPSALAVGRQEKQFFGVLKMRITQKDLECLRDRINVATGSPMAAYTKQADGTYKGNIGHYCLDYAYGGVKLERLVSEGGGVETITTGGYGTKRELYGLMQAFLAGIGEGKQAK